MPKSCCDLNQYLAGAEYVDGCSVLLWRCPVCDEEMEEEVPDDKEPDDISIASEVLGYLGAYGED